MYENIITKKYINDYIRPCSCNDTIFNACLFEALTQDVEPKFDDKFMKRLKAVDVDSEMLNLLDNGLRAAIGYYTLARVYRTGSITATKYGVTEKMSEDSTPATTPQIASNANYLRDMGDKIVAPLVKSYKDANNVNKPYNSRIRIIGD